VGGSCSAGGNVTYSDCTYSGDGVSTTPVGGNTCNYVNQVANVVTPSTCTDYPWDPNCKFYGGSVNDWANQGAATMPPFIQLTDLHYSVRITINGSSQVFSHDIPLASRNTPVWAPASAAYYEGPYYKDVTFNGANCRLMINVGHWGTVSGDYRTHFATNTRCECASNGTPLTPPAQCGGADYGEFNNATEVNNAGLCAVGASSPPVSGAGPWSWTCYSSNGGATASCDAPICVPNGSENFESCSGTTGRYVDNCGFFAKWEPNDPMCACDPMLGPC
jgi:hypothetical protein